MADDFSLPKNEPIKMPDLASIKKDNAEKRELFHTLTDTRSDAQDIPTLRKRAAKVGWGIAGVRPYRGGFGSKIHDTYAGNSSPIKEPNYDSMFAQYDNKSGEYLSSTAYRKKFNEDLNAESKREKVRQEVLLYKNRKSNSDSAEGAGKSELSLSKSILKNISDLTFRTTNSKRENWEAALDIVLRKDLKVSSFDYYTEYGYKFADVNKKDAFNQLADELFDMAKKKAQQTLTSWGNAHITGNLAKIENAAVGALSAGLDAGFDKLWNSSIVSGIRNTVSGLVTSVNNAIDGGANWIADGLRGLFSDDGALETNLSTGSKYKRAEANTDPKLAKRSGTLAKGASIPELLTNDGFDSLAAIKDAKSARKDFTVSDAGSEYIKNAIDAILVESKRYKWWEGTVDNQLHAALYATRNIGKYVGNSLSSDVGDKKYNAPTPFDSYWNDSYLMISDEEKRTWPEAIQKYWQSGYLAEGGDPLKREYSLTDLVAVNASGELTESTFKKAGDYLMANVDYSKDLNGPNDMIKASMSAIAKWKTSSNVINAVIQDGNMTTRAKAEIIKFMSDYFTENGPLVDINKYTELENIVVDVLEQIKINNFATKEEADEWWNAKIRAELISTLESLSVLYNDEYRKKIANDMIIQKLQELNYLDKDGAESKYTLEIENMPRTISILNKMTSEEQKKLGLNYPDALMLIGNERKQYEGVALKQVGRKPADNYSNSYYYVDPLQLLVRMSGNESKEYYDAIMKADYVASLGVARNGLMSIFKEHQVSAAERTYAYAKAAKELADLPMFNPSNKLIFPTKGLAEKFVENWSGKLASEYYAVPLQGAATAIQENSDKENAAAHDVLKTLMNIFEKAKKIKEIIESRVVPTIMDFASTGWADYDKYDKEFTKIDAEVMGIMDKTANSWNILGNLESIAGSTTLGQQTMETIGKYRPSSMAGSLLYGWDDDQEALKVKEAVLASGAVLCGLWSRVRWAYDNNGLSVGDSEIDESKQQLILDNLGSSFTLEELNTFGTGVYRLFEEKGTDYNTGKETADDMKARPIWSSVRKTALGAADKESTQDFGIGALASNFRTNKVIMGGEVDYFINGYTRLFFVKPDLFLSQDNVSQMGMLLNPMIGEIIADLSYDRYKISTIWDSGCFPPAPLNRKHTNPYISYILSNFVKSASIPDLALEVKEGFENLFGGRTSFGTSARKSYIGNDFSVTFNDTHSLYIMNMMQAWVKYIEIMKEGQGSAIRNPNYDGMLDYLGAMYYFVMEPDDFTIAHWGRYVGIYPTTVPWSTLQLNSSGSQDIPEFNVSFKSQYHEGNDVNVLRDFNFIMSGNSTSEYVKGSQIPMYERKNGKNGAADCNINTDPALYTPILNDNRARVCFKETNSLNEPYQYRFVLDMFSARSEYSDVTTNITINT